MQRLRKLDARIEIISIPGSEVSVGRRPLPPQRFRLRRIVKLPLTLIHDITLAERNVDTEIES